MNTLLFPDACWSSIMLQSKPNLQLKKKKKAHRGKTGSFYNSLHCRRYSGGSEWEKVKNNNLISSYTSKKKKKKGSKKRQRAACESAARWIDPDRSKWMLALARSQSWRSTSHHLNNSPAGLLIHPSASAWYYPTLSLSLQQSRNRQPRSCCFRRTKKVAWRRNMTFHCKAQTGMKSSVISSFTPTTNLSVTLCPS